jgi:hypothetical protein
VLVAEFPSSPWRSAIWVAGGGGLCFCILLARRSLVSEAESAVSCQLRGFAKVAFCQLLSTFDLGFVTSLRRKRKKRRAKVTPGREHPLQGASVPSCVCLPCAFSGCLTGRDKRRSLNQNIYFWNKEHKLYGIIVSFYFVRKPR